MVVDTSALIEVLLRGPKELAIKASVEAVGPGGCFVSAASLVEAHVVVRRRFDVRDVPRVVLLLDDLVLQFSLEVAPVSEGQARLAIEGFARYGKGTGGGALNFGDCFSYALAKERNDALLFVGDDFRRTDVRVAL